MTHRIIGTLFYEFIKEFLQYEKFLIINIPSILLFVEIT
jgi:hypothetical protein